jgi:hypothetical protein
LKDKFTALTICKGLKKSIVDLTHMLLRIIYAMLNSHTPFQNRAIDYEAMTVQRNAARWIKLLVKQGFITTATAKLPRAAALHGCVLGDGQPQA